jgi:hypothetical protein
VVTATSKAKPANGKLVTDLGAGKLDTCPRCHGERGEGGFLYQHWAKDERFWYWYWVHRDKHSCYLGKHPEKWAWTKLDKDRLREENENATTHS